MNTGRLSAPAGKDEDQPFPRQRTNPKRFARGALIFCALFAAVIICFCHQLHSSFPVRSYAGFIALRWDDVENCRLSNVAPQPGPASISEIATLSGNGTALCGSAWFVPQGNLLEFSLRGLGKGTDSKTVRLLLETEDNTFQAVFGLRGKNAEWKLRTVLLPAYAEGKPLRFRIEDREAANGWLAMRNRVDVFRTSQVVYQLRETLRTPLHAALLTGLTALLAAVMLLAACTVRRGPLLLLVYFCAAFLFQFHTDVSFYGDDLMFFERFVLFGRKALFFHHNEHMIPLFSAIFFAEFLLFKAWALPYFLISCSVHACNALLLRRLLRLISPKVPGAAFAAALLSLLYAVSGLHAETLQWLTCQSVLFSVTATLICLCASLQYLEKPSTFRWALILLSAAAAPLLFGAGFVVAAEAPLLCALWLWVKEYRVREGARRLLQVSLPLVLGLLPVGALYLLLENQQGEGLRLSYASFVSWTSLLRYASFGTLFASVIRGIGLLPILQLGEGYQLLPSAIGCYVKFDTAGSLAGLGLLLELLGYYASARSSRRARIACWLSGTCIVAAPFALTAVGRSRFGVEFALSLRFQTAALIGLAILLAPAFWRNNVPSSVSAVRIIFAVMLLSAHVYAQMTLSGKLLYYRSRGYFLQSYLEELSEWQRLGPAGEPLSDGGEGSPFAGLQPLFIGGHPKDPRPSAAPMEPSRLYALFYAPERLAAASSR